MKDASELVDWIYDLLFQMVMPDELDVPASPSGNSERSDDAR